MLTDDQIRELKAKHGPKLAHFATELGDVVFRPPTRAEFERFVDEGQTASKAGAMTTLVRSCVVLPTPAEFEQMLDRQPAYVLKFAIKIQDLAGNKAQLEGKEL